MAHPTHGEWKSLAESVTLPSEAFVDGRPVAALSGETFDSVNPATGERLAAVARGKAEDVDRAVGAARRAFERGRWADAAPAERKRVLLRLADLIRERREHLALLDSLDMGKLVRAAYGDALRAADVFTWYAEAIDKLYGEIAPTAAGDLALVAREPVGVVGAVVPWNFPLALASWKVAPALAAGNSVVLKPAEQSPLSALLLGQLASEAGVPDGVLNVVPGFGPEAGRALGVHPEVDCVAFTGSTAVGRLFLGYAGESNMKQVWLECGGKSPNLVFADVADLEQAAEGASTAIFKNQGEVCSANSRLLVHRSVKDELLERVATHASRYRPGDPLDPDSAMGALVDEQHTERVLSYIEHGRDVARLVAGGERVQVDGRNGCFVEPTIFDDVPEGDRLAAEEIFGPVLAVVPFDDEDEAIATANATEYGLAASVWTRDLSRALRVSRRLRAGTVSVNAVDAVDVTTPFGGFKQSGFGRDLSLHALDKYTALKTTWIKY
jgi:4-(gamma-glutamylamino)butanal dehydrogenase